MRTVIALAIITTIIFAYGCYGPSVFSTPMADRKFSMRAYEGMGANPYKDWDDKADKLCGGKFKTLERQYVSNPHGKNYLTGIIECE